MGSIAMDKKGNIGPVKELGRLGNPETPTVLSVLVLEGRERPGGRAWTDDAGGFPADLGCEWLHSADRNVLVPLAERLGLALNRRRPDWTTRLTRSGETKEAEADWLRARSPRCRRSG